MIQKLFLSLSLSLCLIGCNGQNNQAITPEQASPIQINRFDKELFQLIKTNDSTLQADIIQKYPQMLEVLGKGILNLQTTTTPGFFNKLVQFYSEPTLKSLYHDAILQYDSIASIEEALGNGFAWFHANFPTMQIPAVYMHISGFNQNILAGDSLLSISIDKYMGSDYPLYQEFFYDYQRRKMTPSHIVPDYLAGWIMSEYPFIGNENILLDRMIHEGKIKYLTHQALPDLTSEDLMGYTEMSYNWCKENEAHLWKALVERKHLYTPDQLTTSKYFEDTPCTFLAIDAPGNIGSWIGWQIVNKYMEEANITPETLMRNTNSQEILTASKYKPE